MHESLSAVFPNKCAFCSRVCSDTPLFTGVCRQCLPKIPFRSRQQAGICWADIDDRSLETEKYPIYCATWYQEPIRSAVLRLKFSDAPDVAKALTAILLQCWQSQGLDCRAVIAVPLHKDRLHDRGYNQAGLLAEQVAVSLERPDWSDCLVRTKETERQSSLSDSSSRRINLADAFQIEHTAARQFGIFQQEKAALLVLLIDDILTTGVTLTEAARPLRELGLVVCGLVVSSAHQACAQWQLRH